MQVIKGLKLSLREDDVVMIGEDINIQARMRPRNRNVIDILIDAPRDMKITHEKAHMIDWTD
jgi:sRNA-binding carbon storage regulator CsrA